MRYGAAETGRTRSDRPNLSNVRPEPAPRRTVQDELIELQQLLRCCGVHRKLGALFTVGTVSLHLIRGAQS